MTGQAQYESVLNGNEMQMGMTKAFVLVRRQTVIPMAFNEWGVWSPANGYDNEIR